MAATDIMGPARNRVDGRLKVTGAAKYSVEFDVPNCAYASSRLALSVRALLSAKIGKRSVNFWKITRSLG